MASIQARHARGCGLERPWTTFTLEPDEAALCTCKPVFHVVLRIDGKLVRQRIGRNRKEAARARDKLAVAVDEGAYRVQADIGFADWSDRWLAALERKETTRDSYSSTVSLAQDVLGAKVVRRLRPADVSAFNAFLRERGMADSTRAKHLRVLGACLSSAVSHGYAASSPVKELPPAEKPRPTRKESAYFENDDLPPLIAALPEGLFRTLALVALKTGCRQGELLALTWGDIDVAEAVIHVRRSVTGGHVSLPKNHERREVDLNGEVVELLGAWWGAVGRPGDDALVFPGESGGYLSPTTLLKRELYPAMVRAGIPREGPTGEKRTWHSFRHTYARIALEHGRDLYLLSRQLGHSSTAITDTVYGHWAKAARRRQVKLLEGAFPV